jgi:putative PIG3 family NAD(P)H quinone oxidoreductase
MMQAIYLENARLNYGKLDKPVLQAGQLLIKVAYAGVNHADLLQVEGRYPVPDATPAILGLEVSGIVVEVGQGAVGFSVGDKVCALLESGGYGEYVSAYAINCLPLTPDFSLQIAACLPEALITTRLALFEAANIASGENLLLHGGASGVGLIAAQIAKLYGAQVYLTASSETKINFLQKNFTCLNCVTPEILLQQVGDLRFDVVLDILGGDFVPANIKLLKYGGRMVSIACMAGGVANFNIGSLLMKNLTWSGVTLRSQSVQRKAGMIAEVQKDVWELVLSGAIKPNIHAIFPLSEATLAHDLMRSRTHIGKILLEISP